MHQRKYAPVGPPQRPTKMKPTSLLVLVVLGVFIAVMFFFPLGDRPTGEEAPSAMPVANALLYSDRIWTRVELLLLLHKNVKTTAQLYSEGRIEKDATITFCEDSIAYYDRTETSLALLIEEKGDESSEAFTQVVLEFLSQERKSVTNLKAYASKDLRNYPELTKAIEFNYDQLVDVRQARMEFFALVGATEIDMRERVAKMDAAITAAK